MRKSEDKAKTDIRRERYESWLRGDSGNKSVEQRIAESRAKREAAQRIGINKRK